MKIELIDHGTYSTIKGKLIPYCRYNGTKKHKYNDKNGSIIYTVDLVISWAWGEGATRKNPLQTHSTADSFWFCNINLGNIIYLKKLFTL